MSYSRLKFRRDGEIIYVIPEEGCWNFTEPARIQDIESDVGEQIEASSGPKVIMDFSKAEHISLEIYGSLIALRNKAHNFGGQLIIVDSAQQHIHQMAKFAAVQILQFADSVDAAVQSLTSKNAAAR